MLINFGILLLIVSSSISADLKVSSLYDELYTYSLLHPSLSNLPTTGQSFITSKIQEKKWNIEHLSDNYFHNCKTIQNTNCYRDLPADDQKPFLSFLHRPSCTYFLIQDNNLFSNAFSSITSTILTASYPKQKELLEYLVTFHSQNQMKVQSETIEITLRKIEDKILKEENIRHSNDPRIMEIYNSVVEQVLKSNIHTVEQYAKTLSKLKIVFFERFRKFWVKNHMRLVQEGFEVFSNTKEILDQETFSNVSIGLISKTSLNHTRLETEFKQIDPQIRTFNPYTFKDYINLYKDYENALIDNW